MPPRGTRKYIDDAILTAVVDDLRRGATIAETARRHILTEYVVHRIGTDAGVIFNRGRPSVGNIKRTRNPTLNGDAAQTWVADAACRHVPDGDRLFFPKAGDRAAVVAARAICGGCPVRTDCLEYALDIEETRGIWGGLTPYQRARLLITRVTRNTDENPSQEGTPA